MMQQASIVMSAIATGSNLSPVETLQIKHGSPKDMCGNFQIDKLDEVRCLWQRIGLVNEPKKRRAPRVPGTGYLLSCSAFKVQ